MTPATKHLLTVARARKSLSPLGREKTAEMLRRRSHADRRAYYHSLSPAK